MTRRLSILAFAVVLLTLAGAVASAPAHAKQVPFHATFEFTTTVAASPSPCSELRIDVVGSGVATHLGRFTTVQHQCATSADPLAFSGGEYRFTAANGDAIFGTYAGRFVPLDQAGNFSIDATWTIEGGTGRFVGATGGGRASGRATVAGGTVILDGTITSVGSSDRSSPGP